MDESQHSPRTLSEDTLPYEPPEGYDDLAERQIEGKPLRKILYLGRSAILDIVHLDEEARPDYIVMRLEQAREEAHNLLVHTQQFMPRAQAITIFERTKVA
jgi:hypothetical protein